MSPLRITRSCWHHLATVLAIQLALLATSESASAASAASPTDPHFSPSSRRVAFPEPVLAPLPGDLLPTDYSVEIIPDLDTEGAQASTFNGTVTILFNPIRSTRDIVLNSVGLVFASKDVTVMDPQGTSVTVTSLSFDTAQETVTIQADRNFTVNGNYSVEISYQGDLSRDLLGLFGTTVPADQGNTTLLGTWFSPAYARRMMPCFDEPRFRATFELTLASGMTQYVITNTEENTYTTCSPSTPFASCQLQTFYRTPVISPSQFGFVVSDFDYELDLTDDGNYYLGFYTTLTTLLDNFEYNNEQDTAKQMYDLYVNLTGVDSGSDIRMVAARNLYYDSVDAWGFVLIRESALFYLNQSPSAAESNQRWVLEMAKNYARMWFGQLVSVNWENTWLKEGFASYLQYRVAPQVDGSPLSPELATGLLFSRSVMPGLIADSLEFSHPLNNQGVSASAQAIEWRDHITTGKGSAIVQVLQHVLTDTVFLEGIHNYFTANCTIATPEALYSALQSAVDAHSVELPDGVTVADLLSTWVDKSGHPVITAERNYDTHTVTLSQSRFVLHNSTGTDMRGVWWVPVLYSYGPDATPNAPPSVSGWLQPDSTLQLQLGQDADPSWLLVNNMRTGFYRVNYDERNWLLLGGQPQSLDSASRAMLLEDALVLARVGQLRYAIALQVVDGLLRTEEELVSWETARASFDFLNAAILGTIKEPVFKEWLSELLEHVVETVGFAPNGTQSQRLVRGVVMELACDLQMASCTQPAQKDFNKWLADSNSVAHDTLAATVCTGVQQASAADLDRVVQALLAENDDVSRGAIIRGLGCVANRTLTINRLLPMTTSDAGLRHGEASALFKSVSRFGIRTKKPVTDFYIENIADIINWSGKDAAISIYSTLGDRVTRDTDYVSLAAAYEVLDPYGEIPSLRAALYVMEDNLDWTKLYLGSIGDTLSSLVHWTTATPPAPGTESTPAATSTASPFSHQTSQIPPSPTAPSSSTPVVASGTILLLTCLLSLLKE